jgi:predicted metalloprotease with PDZ domain
MPIRPSLIGLALLPLALLPCLAAADVHYTLQPEPQNRSVRVTIRVDDPQVHERFAIPAWCPGFYFLLNYERKISEFTAVTPAGKNLKVNHADNPRQWDVLDEDAKPYVVSYRVLGDDPGLGFFGTSVLPFTAFINGPSAFMYVNGRTKDDATLKLTMPEGWEWATSMDPDPEGEGVSFRAKGYDELIDHPIQMGHFERRKFTVGGIPFQVVFVAPDQKYQPDLDAETERLKAVSAPAIALFGGAAFKRYIFFLHLAVGDFNGGLEHRACNVQAVANTKPLGIDDLAAHEYFHAWNVKQIRPKVLGPFDYTQQVRTANLWFAEGVTDYYAKITTYRSGLHDSDWLLRELSAQVRDLQHSQNRAKYTLADTSRQAWESGGFGIGDLSYYNKGLLVGWIFDAVIRDSTNGEKSLDDVMRSMFKRYRLPQPGYDESGVLAAINEITQGDYTDLYNLMVNSTNELPYEELRRIGILVDPATGSVTFDKRADPRALQLRNAWLNRPGGVR